MLYHSIVTDPHMHTHTHTFQLTRDEATARAQRMFVGKLNVLLVQILKKEWPHNWPSFIPDIVSASKASEVLCTNNMEILKLLRYYYHAACPSKQLP